MAARPKLRQVLGGLSVESCLTAFGAEVVRPAFVGGCGGRLALPFRPHGDAVRVIAAERLARVAYPGAAARDKRDNEALVENNRPSRPLSISSGLSDIAPEDQPSTF